MLNEWMRYLQTLSLQFSVVILARYFSSQLITGDFSFVPISVAYLPRKNFPNVFRNLFERKLFIAL